ncbi:MAG: glycoside hydrolase family 43 protein [Planctomycetota bacterium]|jgi:beta-xylosidase
MKACDIRIRDPFILPITEEKIYYLFGTTDATCWGGPAEGFDCYTSADLIEWSAPIPAFRPPDGFWADTQFWAPEVHGWQGRYYMFASFKAERRYRGTQILVADAPAGPYQPLTDCPITPQGWECLDGTLHVDEDGMPWLVFCQEWVQVHNGAMWGMPLLEDLTAPAGRPIHLFHASEAPWVGRPAWPENEGGAFPTYVTDGPFLHRLASGVLLMLWSSSGRQGYAMGIARSESGRISGPWTQDPTPLWAEDGGHGMLFQTFEGQLMLTFHRPNISPEERGHFCPVDETDMTLELRR